MDKTSFVFGRTSLKLLAAAAMLSDHIACVFFEEGDMHRLGAWSAQNYLYLILRIAGRISFPIFCYVLAQGFLTTRNVKKYLLRLSVFALLSEIPFDLAFSGKVTDMRQQNVLFTMLIGLLVLCGMQHLKEAYMQQRVAVVLIGCAAAVLFRTDYSWFGVALPAVLYVFRTEARKGMCWAALLMCVEGGMECFAVLALPFCFRYSPQKEEYRLPKYFFYIFYPLHLVLLWGASLLHC